MRAFTLLQALVPKRQVERMVSYIVRNREAGMTKLSSSAPTYGRTEGSNSPMNVR